MELIRAKQTVTDVITTFQGVDCRLDDGSVLHLPALPGRFIKPADVLSLVQAGSDGLFIERSTARSSCQYLLYLSIGYVAQPRLSDDGTDFLARVELARRSSGLQAMFLSGNAIRRYFYAQDANEPDNLYAALGISETATTADLRMGWRVCELETGIGARYLPRGWIERAFNILACPELRNCYDALRRREGVPPLFPYGGFGSILVEGRLSTDGMTFFADRILAYKPEMHFRKAFLLLRQCEFFADRVSEPRRARARLSRPARDRTDRRSSADQLGTE